MAAYGLYTHIASNKSRSILLLGGLFLLVYVMVFAGALIAEVMLNSQRPFEDYIALAARDLVRALPVATIGAALWIVIAYFFHQSIIDAVTGGHSVTRKEQPRLYNLLENLCISRGIPMPKLKIVDSEALNAFASGLNRSQYSVSVTTGLLNALDDREMEAVLAHELTHIRNGDVQLMVVAVIIAGVVGFFAELFFRIFFNSGMRFGGGSRSSSSSSNGDKKGGGAFAIILLAVALIGLAWGLSLVVRFALSRSREFLADAGSVELTKDPDAMISALRKIEGRGELPGATSAVMEMCVDNPREGFADLFATHPSVDARVKALVKYAGGHDPGPLPGSSSGDEAPTSIGDCDAERNPHDQTPLPQPGASTAQQTGSWGNSPQSSPSPNGPLGPPVGPWSRR
ncbi:MAG: M48 family metalloprotease [Pseudomonadota bacterium]